MWTAIYDMCVTRNGINRTKDAIRGKWNFLAREFQHCTSARALVATKFPSGRTLGESVDKFMRLYGKKSERKYSSGHFKSTAPFTIQETSAYLAQQPKWQ